MAPSMATVKAADKSCRKTSEWKCGAANFGRPLGIPAKRVPIVSTGRCRSRTAAVGPKVTKMAPGIRFAYLKQKTISAIERMDRAVAGTEKVFQACAKAIMR